MVRDWAPEEIKELREESKLSQKAFGDLLGVTRNFIYYLERGERKPNKTLRLLLDSVKEELKEKGKRKGGH